MDIYDSVVDLLDRYMTNIPEDKVPETLACLGYLSFKTLANLYDTAQLITSLEGLIEEIKEEAAL